MLPRRPPESVEKGRPAAGAGSPSLHVAGRLFRFGGDLSQPIRVSRVNRYRQDDADETSLEVCRGMDRPVPGLGRDRRGCLRLHRLLDLSSPYPADGRTAIRSAPSHSCPGAWTGAERRRNQLQFDWNRAGPSASPARGTIMPFPGWARSSVSSIAEDHCRTNR